MRVLLINTNTTGVHRTIRLGPLYIAAALKKSGNHHVVVIDARHEGLGTKGIMRKIRAFSPQVVGISGVSMEAAGVHEIARVVKEIDKECKVIIGGPYGFSSPEFIMQDQNVDFIVAGEGERTICELLSAVENKQELSGIKGIAFKNNNELVITPPRAGIEDLDDIPFPAWDLIDMEGYFSGLLPHSQTPFSISGRIAPLFTSRGCPYGCIYCHSIFGKHIRFRSVQNVIAEIEVLIARYGVEEIEIRDDCFNFDLERAKDICDEIIRRDLKVKLFFSNGLRVDRMDDELIFKLKKAGARAITYAIESASAEVQNRIRKNIDLEKAKEIIHETARLGILVGGFFMLGFPGETKEQMLRTIHFAKNLPFFYVNFFYVTPAPNTTLFKELRFDNMNSENIKAGLYHDLTFNLSSVPDRELKCLWKKAFREFYFRPSQIWRMWRTMPHERIFLRSLLIRILRFLYKAHVYDLLHR